MCYPFHEAGIEKNNDDARQNYRSSNHWDAAMEILKTEYRLEENVMNAKNVSTERTVIGLVEVFKKKYRK